MNVDGKRLAELKDEDLQWDFGIDTPLDRVKINNAIYVLVQKTEIKTKW